MELLKVYHEVCEEIGVTPKPVWVSEFGRRLDEDPEPDKFRSLRGARAYPGHALEVFEAYGVEKAIVYSVVSDTTQSNRYWMFKWTEADSTLSKTIKWDFLVDAAEIHDGFDLGISVGYGISGGADLYGMSPFENYHEKSGNADNPIEYQSTFEYTQNTIPLVDRPLYPLLSYSNVPEENDPNDSYVLPISFDINDAWVQNLPPGDLIVEMDIKCEGDSIQLRYQSCCNDSLGLTETMYSDVLSLECDSLVSGLEYLDYRIDYESGVDYESNVKIENIVLVPGTINTVSVTIDDFIFQNGLKKYSDISVVPVNNKAFEIHRIEIYPRWGGGVVYEDKSSETQMAYSGQPRNAMALDYSGAAQKDLLVTFYNYSARGYEGDGLGPSGAPNMREVTEFSFLPGEAPPSATDGIIPADFNNDGFADFFAPNNASGGKLYKSINGAYFEDWTTESGLDALNWIGDLDEAFSGSWGDYDADGYPDLAIVSTDSPIGEGLNELSIFHNSGGGFDSVALNATYEVGNSPLWADFDLDGDLDLLVLGSQATPMGSNPPSYLNVVFRNQGGGVFVEEFLSTGIVDYYSGWRISALMDYDNDGDQDIVYADEVSVSIVENLSPTVPGYFSFLLNGSAGMHNLPQGLNSRPSDLAVLDFDLDGYQDVLVTYCDLDSISGTATHFLFANRAGPGSSRILVDETGSAGSFGTEKSSGLAVADYNEDGFSDIYFSKSSSDPFFFKAKHEFGYAQNYWLGIKLESYNGLNCSNGQGATVSIGGSGHQPQSQVVDGGSGLASQHEPQLIFGLGDNSSPASIEVVWPNGYTQTDTVDNLYTYHTIVDDVPVVDDSSVQFSRVHHIAYGVDDWVFTWETKGEGKAALDEVVLDLSSVPQQCWPGESILTEALSVVTVTIDPIGNGRFLHTLTYSGIDCVPRCNIPFTVESAQPGFASTSSSKTLRIKSCLVTP
jgi:hypothetical protein